MMRIAERLVVVTRRTARGRSHEECRECGVTESDASKGIDDDINSDKERVKIRLMDKGAQFEQRKRGR
jgi:hypothetical protein